jgi:aryl-alcohol dehydrogenase-like predicted oxidoreductase
VSRPIVIPNRLSISLHFSLNAPQNPAHAVGFPRRLWLHGPSHGYGPVPDRSESLRLIRKAYDLGYTFFDTAEVYGAGDNELLVLATKFLLSSPRAGSSSDRLSLLEEIEGRLDASLRRLRTNFVDLYYLHRVNAEVPVEDVAWCLGELIRKGKVLTWGMSECTAGMSE